MARCRLRELGITIGTFPTGPANAITDVKGVKVGHVTRVLPPLGKQSGEGAVRTGITAIIPSPDIFDRKLLANGFVLNGAGEVAGMTQVMEWGILETPIALTNTMAVGRVSDGVTQWMAEEFSNIWDNREVVLPVVGECDDSFLNDVLRLELTLEDVYSALTNARSGPVEEGSVGSGTGMVCCDLKGGIGTSSRVVEISDAPYTIGVLVMSNFGVMEELRMDGYPLGRSLASKQGKYKRRQDNYGSIIVIVATDLPLAPMQIGRICKRAALGIGRVGSHAAHGSGEIIVGFSTANVVKHGKKEKEYNLRIIHDEYLDSAYQAVIDATEEAILNSLTMSPDMEGVDGNWVPGINLDITRDKITQAQKIFT